MGIELFKGLVFLLLGQIHAMFVKEMVIIMEMEVGMEMGMEMVTIMGMEMVKIIINKLGTEVIPNGVLVLLDLVKSGLHLDYRIMVIISLKDQVYLYTYHMFMGKMWVENEFYLFIFIIIFFYFLLCYFLKDILIL